MAESYPPAHPILFETRSGVIDLGIGAPDPSLLEQARQALQQASAEVLGQPATQVYLQYGPRPGAPIFREALATFLSQHYAGAPVDPQGLFVTTGATSGLARLLARYFPPGMPALIEDPTYFLARQHLREARLQLITVPQDRNGLDISALEKRLAQLPAAPGSRFRGLVYCVPSFNNPTGTSLAAERRPRLAALARDQRVLVICDDVYDLLGFDPDQPPPARVLAHDAGAGHVVSNGSFSKILGPGVRCGWLEASPALIADLSASAYSRSGGAMSQLTARLLAGLLESGSQDQLLAGLRATLKRRCAALCAGLAGLPPGCSFVLPQGGYFVWVELPPGSRGEDLLAECEATAGVSFRPGGRFGSSDQALRLSFAFHPAPVLREAGAALAGFLRERLPRPEPPPAVARDSG